MKTKPGGDMRRNYVHVRADRAGEGHKTTVAWGVSCKVSWASKPITGAALIEAAL